MLLLLPLTSAFSSGMIRSVRDMIRGLYSQKLPSSIWKPRKKEAVSIRFFPSS